MLTRQQKHILLKFFSMFSVVRGYNILVIVIAQYLASIFILAPKSSVKIVLLDAKLLMLVLASSTAIAAGYIINNFYDKEKDLINRPQKSMLDRLVNQNTKLSFYFVLNFLAIIMASYVSFKSVVFFSLYIFLIWFYSHKLKRLPFLGNLVASVLIVTPFFVIFIYFKNYQDVVFVHAIFLFLIVLIRELVKDLTTLKGDLTLGYKTLPILYSERFSKRIITILALIVLASAYCLVTRFNIGKMDYYFYVVSVIMVGFVLLLWFSKTKTHYVKLYSVLKLIILLGVFSIVLVDFKVFF